MSDFGQAKLCDMATTTFTKNPGTDAYMPPEAVLSTPKYTEKIDCFSFGVLVIQILTRQFPNPTERLKEVTLDNNHPELSVPTVYVSVSETKRRQDHIDIIRSNHPLLPVTLKCLNDKDEERPSAQQLCEKVAVLKLSAEYESSYSDEIICDGTHISVLQDQRHIK